MDDAAFQRWLDAYVDAWRTYDRSAIESLFTDDAAYRYYPWVEPVVGAAAIASSWLEEPDAPGSWSAEYRPWLVADGAAVAVGVSRYFAADGSLDREYHNVYLCRFDAEGRCREFTELFQLRPNE